MGAMRTVWVNGQELHLADNATAADVKRQFKAEEMAVVVVKKPDGFHPLPDTQVLPADAERFSIVPQFRYG